MKILAVLLMAACAIPVMAQSTDLFIMPGSDFTRPGLHPRSNLNIGIGYSVSKLSKSPVGNEMTFSYTYENAGTHGFWNTQYGSHTEALGMMRNFSIHGPIGAYTWMQVGLTSLTGGARSPQNRLYNGDALGLTYKLSKHNGIWAQEQYNKVATVPWYTSTSIGYVVSW